MPDGWGLEFRPKGEKGFYKTYFCLHGRAWASLTKVMDFISGGCDYNGFNFGGSKRPTTLGGTELYMAPPKIHYKRFTNLELGVYDTLPVEKMNEGTRDSLYSAVSEFLKNNPQKMEVVKESEGDRGGAECRREVKRAIERTEKFDIYGIFTNNFEELYKENNKNTFGKPRDVGYQVEAEAKVWEKRVERTGRKVTIRPKNALIPDFKALYER